MTEEFRNIPSDPELPEKTVRARLQNPVRPVPPPGQTTDPGAVAWTPRGFLVRWEQTLALHEGEAGALLAAWPPASMNENSPRLDVEPILEENRVYAVCPRTGDPVRLYPVSLTEARRVALADIRKQAGLSDGFRIRLLAADGNEAVWLLLADEADPRAENVLVRLSENDEPAKFIGAAPGDAFALAGLGDAVAILGPRGLEIRNTDGAVPVPEPPFMPETLSAGPNGRFLLLAGTDETAFGLLARSDDPANPWSVAYAGMRVAEEGSRPEAWVFWDRRKPVGLAAVGLQNPRSAWTSDGRFAFLCDRSGRALILDPAIPRAVNLMTPSGKDFRIGNVVSPDRLAFSDGDGAGELVLDWAFGAESENEREAASSSQTEEESRPSKKSRNEKEGASADSIGIPDTSGKKKRRSTRREPPPAWLLPAILAALTFAALLVWWMESRG